MGLVNTNFPAAGGREMGPRKTKMTMEQKTPFFIGDTTHLQTVVFLFGDCHVSCLECHDPI